MNLERREDGVALVTLDRPKMNAMSVALLTELRDIAQALINNPPNTIII